VVEVHAGNALQSDEYVIGLEVDGQFVSAEGGGEDEQGFQDEPQFRLL
jgi:hypothetical protein